MKHSEYHPTKIKPIIQVVARLVSQNPAMVDNPEYLWANVVRAIPELKDKTHCANCGESMAVYRYTVTILDARLLIEMAKIITNRMQNGMSFTEANKIHLSREIQQYTLISRQTISSKLGLIAKVMKKNSDGKEVHDRKLGWSITRRGFDFLNGKPIPKMVKVFHNKIQEHFDEVTTLKEVMTAVKNRNEVDEMENVAGVFIDTYERPRLL